jgi:hypothetical protein
MHMVLGSEEESSCGVAGSSWPHPSPLSPRLRIPPHALPHSCAYSFPQSLRFIFVATMRTHVSCDARSLFLLSGNCLLKSHGDTLLPWSYVKYLTNCFIASPSLLNALGLPARTNMIMGLSRVPWATDRKRLQSCDIPGCYFLVSWGMQPACQKTSRPAVIMA